MIEYSDFEEKFLDMVRLCAYSNTTKSVRAFYEKLKYFNEEAVFKGFDLLTEDENSPSKLTLSALKSFIRQTNIDRQQSKWNGKECEGCCQGLINENIDGNNYVFRCRNCQSYDMKSLPFHSQEEIHNLKVRLDEIKKGISSGRSIFVNKESRVN